MCFCKENSQLNTKERYCHQIVYTSVPKHGTQWLQTFKMVKLFVSKWQP